jgi:tRNA(fMet)-specific endonuclease VapC
MFVLDSNTISYYFRGDPQVVSRLHALKPGDMAVPAIVVYELRYGLRRLPTEAATPRLAALDKFLTSLQILPFDATCADIAADIRVGLERQGTPIDPHDVLIAATALRHGAALVTRNVREFARVARLDVVNWHGD